MSESTDLSHQSSEESCTLNVNEVNDHRDSECHVDHQRDNETSDDRMTSTDRPIDSGSPDLLYLFLGLYTNSNVPGCWDWLTMHEFANLKCVSKSLRQQLATTAYSHCGDGNDYLLPYPGVPGLLTKGGGLFPHQLASLKAMHEAENRTEQYGELRGGILGDAPGLGKTITLLALVAATAGQRVVAPAEFWGDQCAEAWQSARINEATRRNIFEATRELRWWSKCNVNPTSTEAQVISELMRFIAPPYPDDRFPTVDSLERYIKRVIKAFVPPVLVEQLRQAFIELRAGLDKRSRRLFASRSGAYLRWERSLIPSSATLIIVPDALLEHWFQQIQMHFDLDVFSHGVTNTHGVCYLDGWGDMASLDQGDASLRHVNLKKPVAQPWELSQYVVVVTTFSRCELQLKEEIAAGRVDRTKKRPHMAIATDTKTSSSFLKIRWLRLVVDEGHELGQHATDSSVTRFVNQIAAERRWVLSGTPMNGNEDDTSFSSDALDQLQRLLVFLRHPIYGHPSETVHEAIRSKWVVNIKKPFLVKDQSGKAELIRVLKSVMVMHRKEDIKLPSPTFKQVQWELFVPKEIERDLLAACGSGQSLVKKFDEYLHGPTFQSLVDQAQANFIMQYLRTARENLWKLSGTKVGDGERRDTRPVKAVVYSSEHNILLSIGECILRELGNEHVAELYQSRQIGDMNAELARFRSNTKHCKVCPVCNRNETNFSVMQGGTGCGNQLLEVESLDGLCQRFLIEPERIFEAIDIPLSRMNGESLLAYRESQTFWRVGDCLGIDIRNPHPLLAMRKSEQIWHDEMGSGRCKDLALRNKFEGSEWYFGPLPEVRNGSGLLEVELRKWQPCFRFHSAHWYTGPRLSDQPIEKVTEDVFVMALDASLSHGLDLSFVTHIFLLEPIDDAALLEQVTSRAHRIGATGPVTVLTVNTHYEVTKEFSAALEAGHHMTKRIEQNNTSLLHTVVCDHCFRSFNSRVLAEEHERTNCPRNPANVHCMDPFRLSSVYREIKPPPAIRIHSTVHL
ncbi:hypothetical protein MPSEU_000537300 [Mayamaea pseudoterrestris]|nr:hypothetical protein MPSEU_000537300 [Mayamaea pseudoterrestris]